jgi:hypothetical protein
MIRYLAVVGIACGLVSAACGRQKADAVAIVQEGDKVAVMGKITWVNEGGGLRPQIWKAGHVVIFRVDGTLGSASGKRGQAYRITKDDKLEPLGSVDLTKNNEELAALYGIETKAK